MQGEYWSVRIHYLHYHCLQRYPGTLTVTIRDSSTSSKAILHVIKEPKHWASNWKVFKLCTAPRRPIILTRKTFKIYWVGLHISSTSGALVFSQPTLTPHSWAYLVSGGFVISSMKQRVAKTFRRPQIVGHCEISQDLAIYALSKSIHRQDTGPSIRPIVVGIDAR